jgi:hypothetical protein
MRSIQLLTGCSMVVSTAAAANAQAIDWAKIDTTFGRTAAVAGEIHRYGFPRTDLRRHNPAGIRAGRLDRLRADAGRRDGDG